MTAPVSIPCLHLGKATGRTVTCPACRGHVELKLFHCSRFAVCTPGKRVPDVACCVDCPKYTPSGAVAGAGPSILITGGIGDAITLEAMMPPEFREKLTAIYYACPAAREISQLWQALPGYPRLQHHVILPTGSRSLYSRADVERATSQQLPQAVEDWSIARIFPQARPYAGSSLLAKTLDPITPWERYVVVVPTSSWGRWADRDFSPKDWAGVLRLLERHGMRGLVLTKERAERLPQHPALIDVRGLKSITEAAELVKAAQGYLGIDSWASVLAAKCLPAGRLSVKSVWPHLYQWQHVYYAPRRDFRFVHRSLENVSWS